MDIHAERILIIDFGSQYTQLIARRVRDIGVYCEIHPYTLSNEAVAAFRPAGIILSGGPKSVTQAATPRAPQAVFEIGCPVLGICYGMHTMAMQLGGKVNAGYKREFGFAKVDMKHESALFQGMDTKLDVWMSHGDLVSELPADFIRAGETNNCPIAVIQDEKRNFYGLQFHPEVSHTRQGEQLLEQFLIHICKCKKNWTPKHILTEQIELIRREVKKDGVILGLSGGVDSSVAALLLHQAIGDQLVCVFVDTGLLRLNEAEEVSKLFEKHFRIHLITVNAQEKFYRALRGVSDPEDKRKIIGKTFIEIFEEEAKKIKNTPWLAQGTIYSDVIESADSKTGKAHLIKSHHNVGGLPEKMHLKLIEPLRELFKDEVRKLGSELGLTPKLLNRHPFPGPGLGIRVLGEVKSEYVEKLRKVDAILIDELYKAELYYTASQAFAVFLPIKSVGVVGDARQYEPVVALRIVETIDFMTAHWSRLPYEFLDTVSTRIMNEVQGISRVVYDISSKPPATIEWE